MATQESIKDGGVLVFSEDPEVVGELLTVGAELAVRSHRSVSVAAVGGNTRALLDEGLARGADDVFVVQTAHGDVIEGDESIAFALYEAIRTSTPAVVLVGATRSGAEVAARVAQMLQVPCVSNCVTLELDANGNLQVERRVYGGRFVARQLLSAPPCIATVPPKRFARAAKAPEARGNTREINIELPPPRVRKVSVSQRSRCPVDITKAEVIVAAGRGIKQKEDLAMLEKLATLLGGVLAE